VTKRLLILANDAVKERAIRWVRNSPIGTRLWFMQEKRSTEQSDKMWAMLGDIAATQLHFGRKYDSETWKCIFLNAMGREVKFIPTLDGQSVFPLQYKSSELSKREMMDLITFIQAWADENNVELREPIARAA
jgi:hypothetical protein